MHLNLKFKFESVNVLQYCVQNTSPFVGSRSLQSDHCRGALIVMSQPHKCLASTDHPHEAFDLIDSSRVLAHCRALSTIDADRTPSIDVCRFFGCSGLLADVLERMLKIFLKFSELTTLVAHLLTSRTPG